MVAQKRKRGMFIVLEGGEGAGKTSQIEKLEKRLKKAGIGVLKTREPGGTKISEQTREVLLSKKNTAMAETTEMLLFQAARAQIYDELVLPALREGKWVLADRSRDSSVVYQGMVRGLGIDLVERLNQISTQGTRPDLVILLDVPVKVGLDRRVNSGKHDRLDAESRSFHWKVRRAYLKWAEKNKKRFVIINAQGSFENVGEKIWEVVKSRL